MRVIIDTNVFVSGVFFRGPPHRILQAWRDGSLNLTVSPEIVSEYERVGRKLEERYGGLAFQPVMALVLCHATLVEAPPLAEPACADPDDDKFIACALASECALIISGDRHLLDVDGYAGIKTLRPRDFVDEYLTSNP